MQGVNCRTCSLPGKAWYRIKTVTLYFKKTYQYCFSRLNERHYFELDVLTNRLLSDPHIVADRLLSLQYCGIFFPIHTGVFQAEMVRASKAVSGAILKLLDPTKAVAAVCRTSQDQTRVNNCMLVLVNSVTQHFSLVKVSTSMPFA